MPDITRFGQITYSYLAIVSAGDLTAVVAASKTIKRDALTTRFVAGANGVKANFVVVVGSRLKETPKRISPANCL